VLALLTVSISTVAYAFVYVCTSLVSPIVSPETSGNKTLFSARGRSVSFLQVLLHGELHIYNRQQRIQSDNIELLSHPGALLASSDATAFNVPQTQPLSQEAHCRPAR
jgi:hypothetical protein